MKQETGPETIERVLGSYELGKKLRIMRLRKKIALTDLAKHTGLSASMLSQLENGKLVPTLPTLARIAMVFDVGLDHFFGETRGRKLFSVVRAAERMRFPEKPDLPEPAYSFECLTFASPGASMQAYLADFPVRPAGKAAPHAHEGTEFVYVLEGAVNIRFQGEDHELQAGDSVLLDSSEPHSYRGCSRRGGRAVVVTTPPRL
jgi:transcriptional regulator with XRE-family HTH domain